MKLFTQISPWTTRTAQAGGPDDAYMKAVEDGDMETAQQMVDEAARSAGYGIEAWHGSKTKGITVFKAGPGGRFGKGIYFASSDEAAGKHGPILYRVLLSRGVTKAPSGEYVAISPSQIKSADPITYDDQKNPIPLSRRFDSSNPDIRY